MSSFPEISALMKALAGVIGDHVKQVFTPLAARVDSVEKAWHSLPHFDLVTLEKTLIDAVLAQLANKQGAERNELNPELIQRCVVKTLSSLPTPQPGEKGAKGEDGKNGENGQNGKDGTNLQLTDIAPMVEQLVIDRLQQIPGQAGPKGDPGEKGAPGKDGTPVSLAELLPWLEQRVNESLQRIPLPEPGRNGEKGEQGETGKDGTSVTPEEVAPLLEQLVSKKMKAVVSTQNEESFSKDQVQRLVDKAVQKALQALPEPSDGAPGRDAAALEILPAIELQKSYPRGTYATHAGGLWRSFETTLGLKGWECVVEGIAEIFLKKLEPRLFQLRLRRSSGSVQTYDLPVPLMRYRGLFVDGAYEPGDTVTWAGNLWHCDEATADKPGELNSHGWTLCVKKGRDGIDGKDGKDFTKGIAL
jgi:hypothetical protein